MPSKKANIIKALAANYNVAIPDEGLTRNNLVKNHLIRDDMTAKGQGFLGNINGSNDQNLPAISELSVGVGVPANYQHIPGLNPRVAPLQLDSHQKYFDAPSVIPGMTPYQIRQIQQQNITDEIYNNAEKFAADRQWAGKPVFANPLDQVAPINKRAR
jgi:hypothetical protein